MNLRQQARQATNGNARKAPKRLPDGVAKALLVPAAAVVIAAISLIPVGVVIWRGLQTVSRLLGS